MIASVIAWFKPQAPAAPRSAADAARAYPRSRWRMLESAFVGYTVFYLVRNNFAPVSKELGASLHYDKVMIGNILAGTAVAYGTGKLVLGYLADRCDCRKYIAAGMLLTAALNFAFGAVSSYVAQLLLWTLNGFIQGMGYGPCARGLAHWYGARERGTIFGVWNCAHCVGGGLAGYIAASCAQEWGWRSAFYVPGAIAAATALYLFLRMPDTPQSEGLPPVEEFRNDPAADGAPHEHDLGLKDMLFQQILPNRMLWVLAIANVFVYVARYAMVDWGPTYLKEAKGASLVEGGVSTMVMEFAGAAGMLSMGWVSDRLGGRRGRVSVLAMIPLLFAFLGLIYSGSLLLTPGDLPRPGAVITQLASGARPADRYLWSALPAGDRQALPQLASDPSAQASALAGALNRLLRRDAGLDPQASTGIALRPQTQTLLTKGGSPARVYLGRLLIEDAYPAVRPCRFTPQSLLWLNLALFAVIGFFVYVPVMFSGVMALDLTSKKAAATAAGFVGFFGYVGGRVIQGIGLGYMAQYYGWNAGLCCVIGCIVLGTVCLALLWNVRPRA